MWRNPRSLIPAPPGYASWMKIVVRPVSGCSGVETPPRSQRSHVAISGIRPIAACSAAWIAPASCRGVMAAFAITCAVIVNQSARVSSRCGGSASASSSTTSFVETSLRTKPTTWSVTSTSPNETSTSPSVRRSSSPTISMSVIVRACV